MNWTVVAALALAMQSVSPIDVSSIGVSHPKLVCQLDVAIVRGDLRRLTWSPDANRLHLQTVDRDRIRDYIVALPEGTVSPAFGEPAWAAEYWRQKSQLMAPGRPELKIEVIEDHQRTRPTPFTGGFAANGAQTVDQRNPVDTFAIETKLKFLGEEVGYFLNDVATMGASYGWGPPGTGAIVFVDEKGRVVLFDRDKHKQLVPGTRDAVLPAWSTDGASIAFLQKDGRRSYRLLVSAITR